MISCRIIAYNASKTIEETLRSIKSQKVQPDKVCLFDNCSTDNTIGIFSRHFDQSTAFIHKNAVTLGVYSNANIALRHEDGCEFVHLMHADDVLENDFYSIFSEDIVYSPGAVAWHSAIQEISIDSLPISRPKDRHRYLPKRVPPPIMAIIFANKNIVTWPSVIFNKRIVENNLIEFDESLAHAADWDFWMRLSRCGPWLHSQLPLLRYRISDFQSTSENNKKAETFAELINTSDRGLKFLSFYPLKIIHDYVFCRFLFECARDQSTANPGLASLIISSCRGRYSKLVVFLSSRFPKCINIKYVNNSNSNI